MRVGRCQTCASREAGLRRDLLRGWRSYLPSRARGLGLASVGGQALCYRSFMTHTHQLNVSDSPSWLLSLRLRFGKSVFVAAGPLFALLMPLLAACGGDDPGGVACPAIAAASLGVTVLDAVSSARICDATVTANDGTTSYTLMTGGDTSNCTYVGPFERAGTFSITVTRAGYLMGQKTGVVVTKGVCNVTQQNVTVSLTK